MSWFTDATQRLISFGRAVLSPPAPRSHSHVGQKRPPFIEELDGSVVNKSLRSSHDSPRPIFSSLPQASGNGLHGSPLASPPAIDLTQDDLPERSFASPSLRQKRRRSGMNGPLEEHKRKEEQERYRKEVELSADRSIHASPDGDLSGGSVDTFSDASSFILNKSILRTPAAALSYADEQHPSVIYDGCQRAISMLQLEGAATIDALHTGAKQVAQHNAALFRLNQQEYAHRSNSDSARAQDRTMRRRSVSSTNVAEQQDPLPLNTTSATNDHFVSPRGSAYIEHMRKQMREERQRQNEKLIADLKTKAELLRAARERTEFDEVQRKVDKRIADYRAQAAAEPKDLRELTKAEIARVDKALTAGADEVLSTGFNMEIHGRDMKTLAPSTWLNDEVINFYMQLIKERATAAEATPNPLPKCFIFNSFFYVKLTGTDQTHYDYSGVRRWTLRPPTDIFAMDKVIMPIHLPAHWCCAVINIKEKRFEYYDSLGGGNPRCLKALRRYLVDEYADKKKGVLSLDGWTDYVPSNIPMQKNGHDCGVFSVKFADYCARDKPFLFNQKDMPTIRQRLVLNILDKKAD